MLTAKIHRATVTQADLDYVGSITIDRTLLEASGILPGEQVCVVDVTNGAAAHLVHPGDVIIVIAYGQFTTEEAQSFQPTIVHVGANNRIVSLGTDAAEPVPAAAPVPAPAAAPVPAPAPAPALAHR